MCIRDSFNALPLLKLHEQQIFMLLRNFFHHSAKLPIVFRDYFTLNRSVYSHSTRNCNSLHVTSVQSTFGKRSIKFKGPMLWNYVVDSLGSLVINVARLPISWTSSTAK